MIGSRGPGRAFAYRWLTEGCSVLRFTGVGTGTVKATVATGVPCRWVNPEVGRPGSLAAGAGAIEAVSDRIVLFESDANVEAQDELQDSSGRRWTVRGTDKGRTGAVYLTAIAQERK